MTGDYFEKLERRAEHPHSLIPPTDESHYQMQLDVFVKQHGPFVSVVRDEVWAGWTVRATREDGSVVRGAFLRPLTMKRID